MSNPKTNFRYTAAEKYRKDGISVPSYKDANKELMRDREFIVRINRDQHLNNPIYKSIINALVTNILGQDGAEILWKTDNPILKQSLNNRWLQFTRTADFSNRNSMTELERIILTELLVVGEVLVIKKRSTQQLQIIESERIEKIELDASGEIKYFMISSAGKSVKILAKDSIYISNQERYSCVRGVGALWSCVDVVNMLSFILRSSAKSMGIAARHTIGIEKDDGEEQMAQYAQGLAGHPSSTSADDLGYEYPEDRQIDIEDATMFIGKKGEKLNIQNLNGNPNDKLGEHVLTFCRVISASVGIDAASVVLGDYSKYNYSSSKASHIMLSNTVRKYQNKLTYQFYNRTIKWLIGSWMVSPSIAVPNDVDLLNSFEVVLPLPQIIDNQKEAQAGELEMSLGLALHEDLLLKRNMDRSDYLQQRKQEIISAYNVSKEIYEETGLEVPYQHFCGIPIGKTESAVNANSDNGDIKDEEN